jgi:hypothetical protein
MFRGLLRPILVGRLTGERGETLNWRDGVEQFPGLIALVVVHCIGAEGGCGVVGWDTFEFDVVFYCCWLVCDWVCLVL